MISNWSTFTSVISKLEKLSLKGIFKIDKSGLDSRIKYTGYELDLYWFTVIVLAKPYCDAVSIFFP